MRDHIHEQNGERIVRKLSPTDLSRRRALVTLIEEFSFANVSLEMLPELSKLQAAQRDLEQFEASIKSLPAKSPLSAAFRKIEPQLTALDFALNAEIQQHAKKPPRVCRQKNILHSDVLHLCKPKDGPTKLARFIQGLLKIWPRVPVGMELGAEEFFSEDVRLNLVREHLGLKGSRLNEDARTLLGIMDAILSRAALRPCLLYLSHSAYQEARQQRKGWERLGKDLRTVFEHIRRSPSRQERFRNFERANFPSMRNLTRDQRMSLLPELGNDPDRSVRDLNRKERMLLFKRYNRKFRTPLELDPDGKGSFATGYSRAMKADKEKELGQSGLPVSRRTAS